MNANWTRCAAALLIALGIGAMQHGTQGQDQRSMPGMAMPTPTPTPTPNAPATPMPSPSATPAPQATPAGMEGMEMPPPKPTPPTGRPNPETRSPAEQEAQPLPNRIDRSGWPRPTNDQATYTFLLFDLLEYQRVGSVNGLRWDFLGWHGGDRNRLWFKSEGELNFESPAVGNAELQLLYGRLISPFFDFQIGMRFTQRYQPTSKPTRVFAVIGLQGISPGRFEVEPSLYLSNKGKVSGRFTGTLDLYQTQRWIWQPRLETEFAAQSDDAFGVERGLNDVEVGIRLRYEFRREFAPYFGVVYRRSFGATRERLLREGGNPSEVRFTVGVRMWR